MLAPYERLIHLMGYIKSAALEETGYVVLDRARASEELQTVAVTVLQLEKLADEEPLTLYRPATAPQ